MRTLVAAIILMSSSLCMAAPYPVTSSSIVTDSTKGTAFHGFGFRLKDIDRTWSAIPSTGDQVFQTLRFAPTQSTLAKNDASVSIRMDQMPANSTLESYAKKWMRDYPSYGFEVLGTKNLNLGGGHAILVDLVQKAKNRQLRQVILQKNEKVAVLTCLDRKDQFAATLQTCNQMIRGFEWNEAVPAISTVK